MVAFHYEALGETQVKITTDDNKSMVFNMNFFEFAKGLRAVNQGVYIQTALSSLTPDEREFLISGLLPEEFDELFPDE